MNTSYGYFLKQGYTTWPETWTVKPCCSDTVSKMHGCYNAVGMWFVQGVAGITVDASDEQYQLTVRAGVDSGDVVWAKGSRTALTGGIVRSSWVLGGGGSSSSSSRGSSSGSSGGFAHNITVPVNAVARILIPAASASEVTEGGKPVTSVLGIAVIGSATINKVAYVSLRAGSGQYSFHSLFVRQA